MEYENNKTTEAQKPKRSSKVPWLFAGCFSIIAISVITVGGIASIIAAYHFISSDFFSNDTEEIVLEETPIEIEDIRPRGEIYVCSSIVEDYTSEHKTEEGFFFDDDHTCVQTLTQKVSYSIDLDKIRYERQDNQNFTVTLPEPEYIASTQNATFLSDDEDYWANHLSSTNGLKQRVEQQIRNKYDTQENRRKARAYAESAVRHIFESMNINVTFTTDLYRTVE